MLGALAAGPTLVTGFLRGRDCLATLRALQRLGVEHRWLSDGKLVVNGCAGSLREPDDVLDAGNSGTTARLLLGLLGGQELTAVITGDGSLRRRPMGRVVRPLSEMGVTFLGRANGERLPLGVRGRRPLNPARFVLPVASAQVKSALLLAGLQACGTTVVSEPARSRDHTERLLPSFGCPVRREGLTVSVDGPATLHSCEVAVPGDVSSAFFFVVAATLVAKSEVVLPGVGLNAARTGALDVLQRMGGLCEVIQEAQANGEPRGCVVVRSSTLQAVEIPDEEVPTLVDEIPALAVAACYAEGTSVFRGLGELRAKESDRLRVLEQELRHLGGDVWSEGDTLHVSGRPLRGGFCRSHGDHRIAMALAVAGLASAEGVEIAGADCVDVSFPGFWSLLGAIAPGAV